MSSFSNNSPGMSFSRSRNCALPQPASDARARVSASLWAQGISGDLPIVVVTIAHLRDVEVVREVLTAHTFWHLRGLKVDLVLISEEVAELRRTADRSFAAAGRSSCAAYRRRSTRWRFSAIGEQDVKGRTQRHSVRGPSGIGGGPRHTSPATGRVGASSPKLGLLAPGKQTHEEPSPPLPFMELAYFNGLGGFTLDGKEYAIYLGPETQTPAPWVNIVANPNFGTLVSESGSGFTWYGNSQSNRLTPWFNDPVSDPPGCAIYIRDDDLGVFWSLRRCRSASRTLTAYDTVRATRSSNITATRSSRSWSSSCRSIPQADLPVRRGTTTVAQPFFPTPQIDDHLLRRARPRP